MLLLTSFLVREINKEWTVIRLVLGIIKGNLQIID